MIVVVAFYILLTVNYDIEQYQMTATEQEEKKNNKRY